MADDQATPTPSKSKAQILTDVFSLATQFSTCVEAFNLILPSKDNDHAQKVALAKLGLQQGRLLIWGDAVGISSPPASIAKHMVPSHPGLTNPDPHLPVNFGVRDPRLDDDVINDKVRKALNEIAGRPGNLSRDELMDQFGLKSPKHFSRIEYPALDTNRLESFREKYALLQDLVRQTGARASIKRNMSMTTSHWTVRSCDRFNQFVHTVRTEVDALVELLGVKEQVDRGTRSDIRCMAWHPDVNGPVVQQDWEKLRLIREACEVDYPEYIEVVDTALKYISDELKETSLAQRRANHTVTASSEGAAGTRRKSDYDVRSVPPELRVQPPMESEKTHLQLSAERALQLHSPWGRRPSWLSAFSFKSWSKHSKEDKQRSKSVSDAAAMDPQRSLSEAEANPVMRSLDETTELQPARSKSLSAIPDALDARTRDLALDGKNMQPVHEDHAMNNDNSNMLVQTQTMSSEGGDDVTPLYGATTVNSLIDRHDMYQGVGRIETKDIRQKAHEV